MNLPKGNISRQELLADLQEKPQEAPKKPQKARKGFPIDTLPPKLEEFCKGAETAWGMSPDYLAASILLAVATAIGNTYQIKGKQGYYEKAVFWLLLVGHPNSNKSRPPKKALKPLMDRDTESYKEYQTRKAEYEAGQELSRKERLEGDFPEVPPSYSRFLASDTTPEALVSMHKENLRGISIYVDEGAGWLKGMNRYNKGSELEMYLSSWSFGPMTVDRKTSGVTRVPNPFVCFIGTIQPGILPELAAGNRGTNGFLDRLLFVFPEGLVKPLWTEDEIDLSLPETHRQVINRLADLPFSPDKETQTLTLAPQVRERLFEFFNEGIREECLKAESQQLAGIYGKFDVHTFRLIIVYHLLWWAAQGKEEQPPLTVKLETVERAIKAAEYFRGQSKKVYDKLNNETPFDRLPTIQKKVYEALPEDFKKKEGRIIAERLGMPERTFNDFLAKGKGKLFEKVAHGHYSKNY